jgi:hypothetical protein
MLAVRVNRVGDLSEVTITEEVDYYKMCGFRNAEGFVLQHEWTVNGKRVRLFAKTTGKANSENKYEFPPPVAETLFFGKCLLVGDGDLKKSDWLAIYEELMGGFESLEEEEDEEEEEETDRSKFTKEGYRKDSFVVSDSDTELDVEPYLANLSIE